MANSRNATASWSGYLHQGKVGVFVALKKINELIESGEDLENWQIIYENAEDFDIQEKIMGEWQPDSRHQVKARKNKTTKKGYSNVLDQNSRQLDSSSTIKDCFQIDIFKNDDVDKITKIGEVDRSSRYLHVIVEITDWSESTQENANNIQRYEYSDNKYYCEFSKENDFLETKSLEEIEGIIPDVTKKVSAYQALLWELDQEIRKKHKEGGYPKLSFSQIRQIIENDNPAEISEEAKLRIQFSDVYEDYKKELDELRVSYDDNEKAADKVIENFYQLNKSDFYQLLDNIHPDILNFEKNRHLEVAGLKDVFFKCLLNIQKINIQSCNFKNNGKFYLLTTITRDSPIVSVSILRNKNLVMENFEGANIINGHINDTLINQFMKTKNRTEYMNKSDDTKIDWKIIDAQVSDGDLFLHPKGMSFISADKVIEEINNQNL